MKHVHDKNNGKPSIREETERLEQIYKIMVNEIFCFYLTQNTSTYQKVQLHGKEHKKIFVYKLCK